MRDIISLNGLWEMKGDPENVGVEENWMAKDQYGDKTWINCSLPNAAVLLDRAQFMGFNGSIWYWRTFTISKEMESRHIELCFNRILPNFEVYLNGNSICVCESSEKPVNIPLVQQIDVEKPLNLMIRVFGINSEELSNPIDNISLPWFGIIDNIYLKLTGQLQIIKTKIQAYPTENYSKAHIDIHVDVANTFGIDVYSQAAVNLYDTGQEIFSKLENFKSIKDNESHIIISCDLVNPKFWSIEDPNLYLLNLRIMRTNQVQDNLELSIGIREFKFKENVILINNKPVKLIGTMYRAAYPMCGPTIPESIIRSDFLQMKQIGINYIYCPRPLPEYCLTIADRIGLIVLERVFENNMDEIIAIENLHACCFSWILPSEQLLDKLKPEYGTNIMFGFESNNLDEQSTDLNIISISNMDDFTNINHNISPRIIHLVASAIKNRTTNGLLPFDLNTEEYQAEFFKKGIEMVLSENNLITGVILGEWADACGDFGYNLPDLGIVGELREKKKSYYTIMSMLNQ